MASKKKTPAKTGKMATTNGGAPLDVVDEDGFLCLKGDRLWKWRALDAELRAVVVELDSVKQRIPIEIAKHPDLRALLEKQTELVGAISTAKSELATAQGDIETLLGVSLTQCAFDDRTGRLYNLTEEGQRGEPVKPAPKRRRKRV